MKRMDVEELSKLISDGEDLLLLDVREDDERRICKIDHKEIWIPIGEIVQRYEEVPEDQKIVVYCHHGVRSAQVIAFLESKIGSDKLYNLSGGIDAWAIQIDPTMRKY